jgi:hypothetical protein
MKVSILGDAKFDDGGVTVPLEIGKPPKVRVVDFRLEDSDLPPGGWAAVVGSSEPHRVATLSGSGRERYLFRGKVVQLTDIGQLSTNEIKLEVVNIVLRYQRRYRQLRRQFDAFNNLERADSKSREHIADEVRLFVWQRDRGQCVKCGSNERLEFDHIIPVAKGGSSTERNIQLLCERCNREKGPNL